MEKQPEHKQGFLDTLTERAGALTVQTGRFVNATFKMILGGTAVERIIRSLQPTVTKINSFEPALMKLSDTELAAKTPEFRVRLEKGETLDGLLPEAFAVVREVARRLEGTPYPKRHFDVQMIGGIILHQGKIAEMVTGEGKTLVATLPAYLNALSGKGVHVITVNDYLARRDAAWMSPIYQFLGMTCGAIQSDMDPDERKPIYASDIVYGTNNEFGFDYLRDNMKLRVEDQVQRPLNYAIIDEVDSALIDEARTPLIISGMPEGTTERYYVANRAAQRLQKGVHYEVKEKERTCVLSESGILAAQKLVGVTSFYTGKNVDWPHFIDNALKVKELFVRDKEYVVREGEVLIVDEFTGRLMPGRRWSDGLHQAVEAKENLRVREENQTLATITFQNFFRLYNKLSGMTGTALTEAPEFQKIYNLEVVPIPPNKTLQRISFPDLIFGTDAEKVAAIIEEIDTVHETGRPVLVGTVSVARSEMLSDLLTKRGIKHVVLNAKYHKKESSIVAQAGEPGAVTIATNMAGRGTDIVLGGNPTLELQAELETRYNRTETQAKDLINVFRYAQKFQQQPPKSPVQMVLPGLEPGNQAIWDPQLPEGENIHRIASAIKIEITADEAMKLLAHFNDMDARADEAHDKVVELGGLHIVGTERHEARRIDNQLRGRAGRQGDPGSSRFFISFEDDLVRIFMGAWAQTLMQRIGLNNGQPIESGMASRGIERAQKKVEEQNFNIRKSLLEYDEVMDEQRKLVYAERQAVLESFRERPQAEVAHEIINEFISPEWANGENIEITRSFEPVRSAVKQAANVDVTEDDWRKLNFREFAEYAAGRASKSKPNSNEVKQAAREAIADAIGDFSSDKRWHIDQQSHRAHELGFKIERPWPERFIDLLVPHLTKTMLAKPLPEMVLDWTKRGLHADLPLLGVAKWDYETYQKWIDGLPAEIAGTDFGPLLGRIEKIEPLVAGLLTDGLKSTPPHEAAGRLAKVSLETFLNSKVFRRRPTPERIANWAAYRLGVEIDTSEVEDLADAALDAVAEESAEKKMAQLTQAEDVVLHWHFPAIAEAVRRTLDAEGRDFATLAERLREEYAVEVEPFELSKHGSGLAGFIAAKLKEHSSRSIHCRRLDDIVNKTYTSVIEKIILDNIEGSLAPEERNFMPLKVWAQKLGIDITKNEWLALSREELGVMLGLRVLGLPEDEALTFARNCVSSAVGHFLKSDLFEQDRSYTHIAEWAKNRFSFAASPVKLENVMPRKVDSLRAESREILLQDVIKHIQGDEPADANKKLVSLALNAYFMTHSATEDIDVEGFARWINSKLHISVPAAEINELMDIEEISVTNLTLERAQKSLAKQKPDRAATDMVNAVFDLFLPAETFPDTWMVSELEEWLKKADISTKLDIYKLSEDVHTEMLDIMVDAGIAGYGERPAGIIAAEAAAHAVGTFLDSDLEEPGRNFSGIANKMNRKAELSLDPFELSKLDAEAVQEICERETFDALERRAKQIARRRLHWVERVLILQAIDTRWKDHLALMDSLKSGIGMRGYAQIDPKLAYKKEGYEAFELMIASIQEYVSEMLLRVEIDLGTEVHEKESGMTMVHGSASAYQQQQQQAIAASQSQKSDGPRPIRADKQPNRNEPCPCGSGKKYKNCCMGK